MTDSPVDLRIVGAEKLGEVARALREVGEKELRRELGRAITRSVKPLRAAVKAAALDQLPAGGGLNRRVAKRGLSTKTRTGRDPGVRLVAKNARDIDRGKVRHPVFGNRNVWVTQAVEPGYVTETVRGKAPAVRAEIVKAIEHIGDELERRLR